MYMQSFTHWPSCSRVELPNVLLRSFRYMEDVSAGGEKVVPGGHIYFSDQSWVFVDDIEWVVG